VASVGPDLRHSNKESPMSKTIGGRGTRHQERNSWGRPGRGPRVGGRKELAIPRAGQSQKIAERQFQKLAFPQGRKSSGGGKRKKEGDYQADKNQ